MIHYLKPSLETTARCWYHSEHGLCYKDGQTVLLKQESSHPVFGGLSSFQETEKIKPGLFGDKKWWWKVVMSKLRVSCVQP